MAILVGTLYVTSCAGSPDPPIAASQSAEEIGLISEEIDVGLISLVPPMFQAGADRADRVPFPEIPRPEPSLPHLYIANSQANSRDNSVWMSRSRLPEPRFSDSVSGLLGTKTGRAREVSAAPAAPPVLLEPPVALESPVVLGTPVLPGPIIGKTVAPELFSTHSTPASSLAASSPPASTNRTETRPGEVVVVELPGPSWLYLGNSGNAELLSRVVSPDMAVTRFSFTVTGPVTLEFEAQDLETGRRQRHEEEVAVIDGEQPALVQSTNRSTPNRPASGSIGRDTPEQSTDTDLTVDNEGQYDRERQYDPQRHAEIIAAIDKGDKGDNGDTDTVLQSWETAAAYLQFLEDTGQDDAAVEMLEHLWAQQRWRSDEVLYRLARYYDTDRPTRNVRRARDLYRQLTERYIFSSYVETAEQRYRFLNRHFFHIR